MTLLVTRLFLFFMLMGFGTTMAQPLVLVHAGCNTMTARCTGSAACKACKNCSLCAHCSNGGSCGVCAAAKTKKAARSPLKEKTFYGGQHYAKDEVLYGYRTEVPVRNGPGTAYEVIHRLKKNEEVYFIEQTDAWIKVRIKKTNKVGWVHYEHLSKRSLPPTAKEILRKN